MRCLERNKRSFYYALYEKTEKSGSYDERRVVYREPVLMKGNISTAFGTAQVEQFGNSAEYDRVIVIDDINCPIDENSVLFIDKQPERDSGGNLLYDYIVKKVAKSLNSISVAVKKVSVT